MVGFIFLDKPEGITSFTAVNKVRKICNIKKAGHTGTLDPMATGVLPIMVGGATRFSQYLPIHDKSYRAEILLGKTSDTLDITGEILSENEVNVTNKQLAEIISEFVGNIEQYPPMYSAVSKDGVRLYKLARQGIEIEREKKAVTIYNIDIIKPLSDDNKFTVDVSCSAGTYIRSLADDIGKKAGCGALLTELRRTQANGISIEQTVTFKELQQLADSGKIEEIIVPCDKLLECYPDIHISQKQSMRFNNGGELDLERIRNKNVSEG
ncbi:MAG: tRNA pseudouridine(55) synthase TruB, partial [Ruminococcus sp.]|nr:tRNA pseudouridine(55) synthase TruB [Candidatus Copronaster equi]